jgi:RsiW-degrading membrane proteinase PrsW (M82 family)
MPVRRRESVVFTVVISVIAAVAAIPMAIVLALSGGGGVVLLAALFALIPVGPLVACYLWLDRYEPEPKSLLAAGLAWGAFVSTFLALVVQGVGGFVAGWDERTAAVWVAPLSEEATKGLFLVLLMVWRRHELDGILDGIVYAGMVGIGFAFTENILYLAAAYNGTDGMGPGGISGLGAIFVIRCLASPFAHPLFTAFFGIGVGLAIFSRSPAVKVLAPIAGYALAVLAHSAWNAATLIEDGFGFVIAYVLVMVPGFLMVVGFAVWMRGREKHLLHASLTDAANRGLIAPADIPHVVDLRARRHARNFARTHGGPQGLAAMRDFQQAAVELGFLHHRFLRGTAPANFEVRGQGFVERMRATRPWIAFPPIAGAPPAPHAHRPAGGLR